MIEHFRHKGLKRLFQQGEAKGISPDLLETLENILFVLSRARRPEGMKLPVFRLPRLKGTLRGCWSVIVRQNWRVIFHFGGGDAFDVGKECRSRWSPYH